jgi:hypothetical protein
MQITVDLPNEFGQQISEAGPENVSHIFSLGLREWRLRDGAEFAGLHGLLERLAQLPEPSDVLNLRPTLEMQTRATELLEKNKSGSLSEAEESEWQRLELAEHLVRIAKATAALKLQQS